MPDIYVRFLIFYLRFAGFFGEHLPSGRPTAFGSYRRWYGSLGES